MTDLQKERVKLIGAIRKLAADLVEAADGYIDENFISEQTLEEVLIMKENPGSGSLAAHLDEDYEYNLFNNLFYDARLNSFYHYTSFESLFHIINSGQLHLNSLIGLNDKSEVNFVNNFMSKGGSDPYNPVTMMYHNSHFLFCFSENAD